MMKLPVKYDAYYHKIYDANGRVICFTQWNGSGFDYQEADDNGKLIVERLNGTASVEYPPIPMPSQKAVVSTDTIPKISIFEKVKSVFKKEKVRKSYRVRKYIDAKGNIYEVKGSGRVPKGWTVYSGEAEQIKSVG